MLGGIFGDIIGSKYEFHNHKSKQFNLFDENCRFTDDTVMTIAIMHALILCHERMGMFQDTVIKCMQYFGQRYPKAGYGRSFYKWIYRKYPEPYNSFGNGAAMRISGIPYACGSLDEVLMTTELATNITHNHPEGIKAAKCIASCIWIALNKGSMNDIKENAFKYYKIDFNLDEIRPSYKFDVTCQGSVPQAIECFLESKSYEDCIRNAISIGGDSDTIACIAGSIAGEYYGIPNQIEKEGIKYIDGYLLKTLYIFDEIFNHGKYKSLLEPPLVKYSESIGNKNRIIVLHNPA